MTMQEKLYELFLLDKQVRGIRRQLDGATRRHTSQKSTLDQLLQQHDELNQQLKVGQAKAMSLEHQARDMEKRIAEFRQRMNTVTNNKEYSALLIEVNTLKAEMSKVEDEALDQMSSLELVDQEKKQIAETMADRQKLVDAALVEVDSCREQVGQRLDDLTAKRDSAEQELPQETRSRFNRLSGHCDGDALAEIIEEDRKNMAYTCGGCYMSVPIEHVNSLLARPDTLVCCTSCSRILYIDQALKTSIGVK